VIDRDEGLLDADEDAAELAGLRARVHELRRENEQLRLRHITLLAENELLKARLAQQQAVADDVAAALRRPAASSSR
jgi:regulator of replication initiation timing